MCAHEAPVRDMDPNLQKGYHETRRSLLSSKYIPMRPKTPYMEAGMRLKLFRSLGGFGTCRHSRDLTKSKSNTRVESSALDEYQRTIEANVLEPVHVRRLVIFVTVG